MVRSTSIAMLMALTLAGAAQAQEPDQRSLAALEQRIRSGEIAGVHSVLVASPSGTLAEWYYSGADEARGTPLGVVTFGPETLHDVRSVTKSIVALLVGVAVEEGAIASLDVPVLDFFPEYADLQTPDRRRITLRHLLTMTSGLQWDEQTYPYNDPRNSEIAMDLASDPYRYALSQQVEAPAGERFGYSGGDVALMAEVLARATNTPLDVYAEEKLFQPLAIDAVEWHRDARGVPYAASGLRMTPRHMARIGRMMLQNGRWQGRQVVPADWVMAVTQPYASVQPDPTCGTRYGYFWWLSPGCHLTPPQRLVTANGNGGQRIVLVPERNLVIVTTAGLYNQPGQSQTINLAIREILAALR